MIEGLPAIAMIPVPDGKAESKPLAMAVAKGIELGPTIPADANPAMKAAIEAAGFGIAITTPAPTPTIGLMVFINAVANACESPRDKALIKSGAETPSIPFAGNVAVNAPRSVGGGRMNPIPIPVPAPKTPASTVMTVNPVDA